MTAMWPFAVNAGETSVSNRLKISTPLEFEDEQEGCEAILNN